MGAPHLARFSRDVGCHCSFHPTVDSSDALSDQHRRSPISREKRARYGAPKIPVASEGLLSISEPIANTVLFRQKESHFLRHCRGQFLPRDYAHAASEFSAHNRRHNLEAILNQILTALVAEHSEGCCMRMGSQGAANQLAGAKPFFVSGQSRHIEDGLEIAIAMHQVVPCALKISFGQLCFNQQPSQLEVLFTSILCAIFQGDSGPETEIGMKPRFDPEQGTDSGTMRDARIAKDIHKQRVRT